MDPDLQDLLASWMGGELDEGRRGALLARLRGDDAFRLAFVEEIRMLGMLKAVQSTDPRWLALEDELGWSAGAPVTVPLEDRVLDQVRAEPPAVKPTSRAFSWRKAAALAAAVLAAGFTLYYLMRPGGDSPPPAPAAPQYVAVVVKLDAAQWEGHGGPAPSEGKPLPAGKLKLASGRATMTFFNGVMLSMQGPAELDLTSVDRIFCQQGKLRARVPAGAEGFAVFAPGSAVVDLGTEFGMNVAADGKTDLMLFEGKAEVSLLNSDGHTLRSELLEGLRAVSLEPTAGRIRSVRPKPEDFVAAPELIPPRLLFEAGYPGAIRESKPWGYWRFETLEGGAVPNEIAGGPALRATGPLKLGGVPGQNRTVAFGRTDAEQHLIMDDSWAPPRDTGYAVELWALTEEINAAALVGLNSRADEPAQKHIFILELAGRGHHLVHEPCRVRYLDRWPPAHSGGVNAFSQRMYVPYRWHHIVARREPGRMELYMDGDLVGASRADEAEATAACRMIVGRLKHGKQPGRDQERPFVGLLDELAVYEHPLSPEEIRRHYELRIGNKDLLPAD